MNSDRDDRREHDVGDLREQLLASLLVAYDEALGDDTRPTSSEALLLEDGPELVTRFREAKSCLELLDRVRRRGTLWEEDPQGAIGAADSQQGGHDASRGAAEPFALPPLPERVGRFLIERELGRGGLGIVYLATDPKLGRQVAIKVPRFESVSSDAHRRRLLREAEAAARLSHPNLVALYEVGEDGSTCYLACEYCAGPTLSDWLRRRRQPVPVRQAALIILKLAEAVEHAHSRGVLHRDIKPSNVLLEAPRAVDVPGSDLPADIVPKLTDFGMAKLVDAQVGDTHTGTLIGTVRYMSPEQAEGSADQLDSRTDIYALGAILYELLVDVAPHDGCSDVDTLRRLILSEPVPPRERRPEVPRDLQAVVLKCLSKRPGDRYATAHALAGDLRRFLSGKPTLARPLHSWERVWKWARRRPAVAALCCVSLLAGSLLSAGGVFYTLRLRRHAEELRQALADRDKAVATAESHEASVYDAYPTDLRLAQEAWKDGRDHDAMILLRKHEPHLADHDHRTFEWYFLSRMCRVDRLAPVGNEGAIFVCRYSPNGKLMATGGADGQVRLWDVPAGKLARSWRAHDKDIDSLIFSADNLHLVTTAEDQFAAVWSLENGTLLHRFEENVGPIHSTALMPDGQTLLAATEDGGISFWNTSDWKLRNRGAVNSGAIMVMAISANGLLLATATSTDNDIKLWSLPDLLPCGVLPGHGKEITALAFSHRGEMLASISRDYSVRIWDPRNRRLLVTRDPRMNYLHDIAFTADDSRLLVAGHEGVTQVWELASDSCERSLRSTAGPIYSVAISPDGRQVATGAGDGTLHLWNDAADPEKTRLIENVEGRDLAITPDKKQAAISGGDGQISFYDLATGSPLRKFAAHPSRSDGIGFSHRGNLMAVGFDDLSIRLWNFPDLTPVGTLTGHGRRVWSISFSPTEDLLASCSDDRTVRLWDVATGVDRVLLKSEKPVRGIGFSPDGRLLATACKAGIVRITQVSDGKELVRYPGHSVDALCVAWSHDGNLLATGAVDSSVCLWNVRESRRLTSFQSGKSGVYSIAFSPDGKTMATGEGKGSIKLWDLASREQTLVLNGHGGQITNLFFSPLGDALYSYEFGSKVRLCSWQAR
jgi:eukaryotic-like serine/threonine-protein kinase